MVPGLTERERLATDLRRQAWLAAVRDPVPPPRAPRHLPVGFLLARRAAESLLCLRRRRRPTPTWDGSAPPVAIPSERSAEA